MLTVLDLFCGCGAASEGYARAGFRVVGVDIEAQENYRFEFVQRDVLELGPGFLGVFDLVHASAPCQAFSDMKHAPHAKKHPDLISPTRVLLRRAGVPYVIENVEGAPLIDPVVLCGSHFGLGADGFQLRRHRLFEASFPIQRPRCEHRSPTIGVYGGHVRCRSAKYWRDTAADFPGRDKKALAMQAMGLDTAIFGDVPFERLSQCVPPAFTEYVGLAARQFILMRRRAA